MERGNLNLINKTKIPASEVLEYLRAQKCGTPWAIKTNYWAVDCAQELVLKHGEVWWKGLMPKEFLGEILLPNHGHSLGEGKDHIVFFPNKTKLKDAIIHIESFGGPESIECLRSIEHLKTEIKLKGFNTRLFLSRNDNELSHIDGLHRMIALQLLIEEGYDFPLVPIFLCETIN